MYNMLKNFESFNTTTADLPYSDESYTIVLNSNLATGTLADAQFNFDWSVIPNRNYLVHYSFNTSNMNIASGKVCMISSTLFSNANAYFASGQADRTASQTTNVLGIAYPYIYGAVSSLHAEDGTAPPIYLNARPVANQFTIHIKTADATPIDYPNLGEWVLILRLEPVDRPARKLL